MPVKHIPFAAMKHHFPERTRNWQHVNLLSKPFCNDESIFRRTAARNTEQSTEAMAVVTVSPDAASYSNKFVLDRGIGALIFDSICDNHYGGHLIDVECGQLRVFHKVHSCFSHEVLFGGISGSADMTIFRLRIQLVDLPGAWLGLHPPEADLPG